MEWPGSDLIPIRDSERNAVGIQSYIYEVPRDPLYESLLLRCPENQIREKKPSEFWSFCVRKELRACLFYLFALRY